MKEVKNMTEKETRVYEITGKPQQLDILERVLGRISYWASVGMSRSVYLFVDGDGAVDIRITRNGQKLNHEDIKIEGSDAHFTTMPDGRVRADLG
jgi:hypothetical protein